MNLESAIIGIARAGAAAASGAGQHIKGIRTTKGGCVLIDQDGQVSAVRDGMKSILHDCMMAQSLIMQAMELGLPVFDQADRERLFNCCTKNEPPLWADKFTSLEISGCIDDGGNTTAGISDDKAQFWTVYARIDGMVEAITDCPTKADAQNAAGELSKLWSIPVL